VCSFAQRRHTAAIIEQELKAIVERWGIQNKIAGATTDNADNVVNAVTKLGWRHVPCVAHTLNLVLQHAVLECEPFEVFLKKAKRLVKRIRKSTSVLAIALERSVEEVNAKRAKAIEDANLAATAARDVADKAKASGDDAAAAAAELAAVQAKQHAEQTKEANQPLPLKLKQHVKTRWNSVYLMLDRLLLLRAPLVTMLANHTGDGQTQVRGA
jgi:hypothetical protein